MTGSNEGTIYNSTDGPLPYDRAGRMIPARGRLRVRDVDAYPIKGHVDGDRFVRVESRDDDPVAPTLDTEDTTDAAPAVEADPEAVEPEVAPVAPQSPARGRGRGARPTQED